MEGSSNIPSELAWVDLTSPQLPIWLDLQSGADPSSYIIGGYIRIPGPVDPERFDRAVALVVARNDALRLRFHEREPLQRSDFTLDSPMAQIDLRGAADADTALHRHLEQEFPKPFDLAARGYLFRITLIQFDARLWYCVLKFHHLIADGMSISLVFDQICEAYNGRSAEPHQPQSYAEFARDDAAYLASRRYRADLDYWRERFRTVPKEIFPLRPGAAGRSPASFAAAVTWQLPWPRYQALIDSGKARGTTPFAVLLGLLGATLARMRGETDLTIGVPVLNRSNAAMRRAVGMFAGAMPLRLRVPHRATLAEIAAIVATQLRRDFRHQRAPVNAIVRELGLPQRGRWRLFDVVLSFEPNDYDVAIGGATVQAFGHVGGHEVNPLAVYVREYNVGRPVSIDFAFNSAHLERADVADLQHRFALLLDAYLDNPDARLDTIDLVTPDERARLLGPWCGSEGVGDDDPGSVVGLFLARVSARPDGVAVEGDGVSLSYRELGARTARLAHRLRGLGVGSESVVGVALPRGIDAVVAVLAIWRAGGAYLALDPAYPDARLGYMLTDSGVALVLSHGALAARLGGLAGAGNTGGAAPVLVAPMLLMLDDAAEAARLAALPATALPVPASLQGPAQGLAYVIYTSGSTGQPKPVAVSHGALLNHTRWLNRHYRLGPADRVLLKTSLSFDASVWELISPLSSGATLVVAEAAIPGDVAALARALVTAAISVVQVVPSLLAVLLEEAAVGAATGLRLVLCGGAALAPDLARRFAARLPGAALHNLYGPTETTIDASSWACTAADAADGGASVPIGRGVAGLRLYVLDRGLGLVPVGVVGELYVGGVGLARGYRGRGGATA
ncbi:MAG TPA: AMP-binding protein, partial [Stellaceae bacterium]